MLYTLIEYYALTAKKEAYVFGDSDDANEHRMQHAYRVERAAAYDRFFGEQPDLFRV